MYSKFIHRHDGREIPYTSVHRSDGYSHLRGIRDQQEM